MRYLKLCSNAVALIAVSTAGAAWSQQATTFTYDALGRVTSVLQSGGPANGTAVNYSYDPAGNRSNYVANTSATLSISGASANEGSPLTFTVTRSGTMANAATVNYATSNGSAISGVNYTASSGSLNFPAGVSTQTITVQTRADGAVTSNLTMTVTISSPSGGASIATANATGTINNTDATPFKALNPSFSVSSASVTNITLANLATTNGQAAKITSFSPSGGNAVISSDKQSVSYTAPTIGQAAACEPAVRQTYSATYAVQSGDGSQTVNGTVSLTVAGLAGPKPKPPASCP